jgi:hypothetical protein
MIQASQRKPPATRLAKKRLEGKSIKKFKTFLLEIKKFVSCSNRSASRLL